MSSEMTSTGMADAVERKDAAVQTDAGAAEKKEETVAVSEFDARLARHYDELKWLYMELYDDMAAFEDLCKNLRVWYEERKESLKRLDREREADPSWCRKNNILGMMMYVDCFAGTLKGVQEKLDYIKECNVNYLHLMPLLASPEGRNDGGYAVADFRTVEPKLGTMDDLEQLADICHDNGISICLDFVMNHTSEDHEWAVRAKNGEKEYMDRYFFFDNFGIPAQYERTVPQVFPTTAPGNFTWLPEQQKFVMTTFYPYQWDLNYRNPVVLNEMVYNMLNLTNKGVDIIRIDAVPYIWKELGTSCRNLPQVHNIVRIMRMISEIVCPAVILLGEVVMEPAKVVPYFGSVEKPECHMLYNVTTMASTWHTVATRDVRLLKRQMDIVNALPKEYIFLNYLRCHDDIGWGLDYPWLGQFGLGEVSHKKYLNDFLTGNYPDSFARGELYNSDPTSGDARLCGTTASLCGIEKAEFDGDASALERAIRFDIMLHAYMFTQSGIPVIYSGDEIGQLNDYDYKNNPNKAADSRYLHRGKLDWELADKRTDSDTVQGALFQALKKMEEIRSSYEVFSGAADVWTLETWEQSVLCIGRYYKGQKLIAVFNFSEYDKTAWIDEDEELYTDLLSGRKMPAKAVDIPAYGVYWLLRTF